MKRLIVFLLALAVTSPVLAQAQPNFLDEIHNCVAVTVEFTMLTQLANESKDTDKNAFMDYVQQVANHNAEPVKSMVLKIGKIAWDSRGTNTNVAAMAFYDACYNSLGQHT